jgi:hypothetical protein
MKPPHRMLQEQHWSLDDRFSNKNRKPFEQNNTETLKALSSDNVTMLLQVMMIITSASNFTVGTLL